MINLIVNHQFLNTGSKIHLTKKKRKVVFTHQGCQSDDKGRGKYNITQNTSLSGREGFVQK